MKLRAAQPASLEAIPKQDGVHLPRELIDLPHPVLLDGLAGRIEGQTVEFAQRVDFAPAGANVGVLQGDMIGPVGSPAWPSSARVKALTLRHELGDAADSLSDPARFFRRELAGAEAVTLRVVAAIQPGHGHTVGVLDGVALGILPDQGPGRLETAG